MDAIVLAHIGVLPQAGAAYLRSQTCLNTGCLLCHDHRWEALHQRIHSYMPLRKALRKALSYILRGITQGHKVMISSTHWTIYMTGCQHGAGGFRPLGPPVKGGALLRSTIPNARRPHPTRAARRWRARVRLRRTSPSPTPVKAALLCHRRPSDAMTRRALSLPGLRRP